LYLEIKNVSVYYDTAMVLNSVSLGVEAGELVSIVGPNGAGKTTLLRTIAGLIQWEKNKLRGTRAGNITQRGNIIFDNEEISDIPAYEIAKRGLILCPERGRPFPEMTVQENLVVGAFLSKDQETIRKSLDKVYELFPVLKLRKDQVAGTLSGGERTMLAIGRSLMSRARLMLVDEPSTGLAPKVKESLFERLREVHGLGITIFMTEQDVSYAFDLATRNYVLSQGQVVAQGTSSELLADEFIRKTFLGL
jgi:branched-chain amino acid transport system ATP-binding protein